MSKQASRVGVRNDQVDIYGRINTRLPLIDDLASFLPYHTELNVYKDGTEQLLPVNTSEPTTSPILADIRYPTGVWRNKQYFTYRESPTEATGKARIKSIKGNTLVWNQQAPVISTTNYAQNTGNVTFGTNTVTVTATSSGSALGIYQKSASRFSITGHSYLCIVTVKASISSNVQFGLDGTSSFLFLPVTANTYKTLNCVVTAEGTHSIICYLRNVASGDSIEITNLMCIDLTFLNDSNITDYNSFKTYYSLPYYAHDSGSLLSFTGTGIKTTGKNLLDVTETMSGIFTNNGDGSVSINGTASGTVLQKVGSVDLIAGKTYALQGTGDVTGLQMSLRNSNGSTVYVNNLETYTPTENVTAYYYYRVGNGTTISNAKVYPQIEFGSTATSYEPYTSSTLSLPISTYFPTGMKDVPDNVNGGKIYDELSDKAVTRVTQVDLGSIVWSYSSGGQGRFESNGIQTTVKKPSASSVIANIKCAKYQTASVNNIFAGTVAIGINTDGYVWVYDSTYGTDADAFKSAMSGVYLNYELATYTEESTLDLE